MPQRTNAFQKLVALIHKIDLPPGAKITESAMVQVPSLGEFREIDVLLESPVGLYRMKIAIEAKNHKRKLTVTDIEAIIGKYRSSGSLIVNSVVLVSSHGFSKQAIEKAKLNGITLMTLSEAETADWQLMFPQKFRFRPQSFELSVKPHVANLELRLLGNQTISPLDQLRGRLVCRCHRNDFGTATIFAEKILNLNLLKQDAFCIQLNERLKKEQKICSKVAKKIANLVFVLDGKEYEAIELRFHVHATSAKANLDFKTYEFSGDDRESKIIQHATATMAGRDVEFLMHSSEKEQKLMVQFGKCSH